MSTTRREEGKKWEKDVDNLYVTDRKGYLGFKVDGC
jgi:hypothetical protein